MSKTLEEVREIFSAAQKTQLSLQPQITKERVEQNQKTMKRLTPEESRNFRLSQPKITTEQAIKQVSQSLCNQTPMITLKNNNLILEVEASVRYWEDAMVNGEEDSEGNLIPFRSGDGWYPKINTETGEIIGWPEGVTADIHYKICDAGEYFLSRGGENIYKYKDYYVPDFLAPNRDGYGDYVILNVDGQGKIKNWKFEFDESEWKKI